MNETLNCESFWNSYYSSSFLSPPGERWTHSWEDCCVKMELSTYLGPRASRLDPSFGSFFNSCWVMHHLLFPLSKAKTDFLHGRRPAKKCWDHEEKAKSSNWIILQTGFGLLGPQMIHFNGLYCDCCSIQDGDSPRRTPADFLRGLWLAVGLLLLLTSIPGPRSGCLWQPG